MFPHCRRYLIIIPAALPYPSSQRACLDLRGVEKPIRVVLTLVHPSGNLSLYRKVVRNNGIFECTRFQVRVILGRDPSLAAHSFLICFSLKKERMRKTEDKGAWKGVNAKSRGGFSGSLVALLLVFVCLHGTLPVGYPSGILRKGCLAR